MNPIDICLFVLYVNMCVGMCREQKKVSDPLKLELESAMSCQIDIGVGKQTWVPWESV